MNAPASKPLPGAPPRRGVAPPAGAPTNGATPAAAPSGGSRFSVVSGRAARPQRVLIYGTAGIGKSTLAALAPKPIFLDIEGGTDQLDVDRIGDLHDWNDVRACLQSGALDGYATVVIDSATKAEELAVAHTLATVKHEKGHKVESLAGYGFGKGPEHVYDTFLHLLVDCDRHVRAGRNVVLIAHACTTDVPNPMGEDFLQYQPRLQTTKKGGASIRNRVIEWCDHVLFVGYDVLAEEGKGKGAGTRTIYVTEDPTHIAKIRGQQEPLPPQPFESAVDGAIWTAILEGGAK